MICISHKTHIESTFGCVNKHADCIVGNHYSVVVCIKLSTALLLDCQLNSLFDYTCSCQTVICTAVRLSTACLSNCQLYILVNLLYSCQTVICTPDRLSTVQPLGCKLYSCRTVNCTAVRL